ncbi:GntR family transcriptional regulator [Geodermatophilus sp. DSM 44513]|uniref:GntR family transcriptional regulator n=1 Tax=Geodermatophilus sp. DSM 44513 TaxID=1528104 RepID=UPI001412772D|nr:GntR family transcriptional regulator [Geodermatophilus sp. DSM 44513]WNV77080.1 GntR family transcriptional regulator [Geodermatophilus sp. DSM 44513]
MTALEPGAGEFERRTTSDDIADALRDAIARGDFADGEELNQVTLARHFGVSRVPVREALRQLQAEGLISAKAHMRAVVTALTVERVAEVLDLRIRVESYLLGRAAPRIGRTELAELRALCDEMEQVDDHEQWLTLNKTFHGRIYAHSGAELALDMSRQLTARVQRYLHIGRTDGVHRNEEANAEHRRILEALAAGDAGRACAELEAHIGRTRARIVELLEQRRTDDVPTHGTRV